MRRASLLVVILGGCGSPAPERWDGFFYPDRSDLMEFTRGGPFRDLQSCRNWAAAEKSKSGRSSTDYECGRNCRPAEFEGINVCEETMR